MQSEIEVSEAACRALVRAGLSEEAVRMVFAGPLFDVPDRVAGRRIAGGIGPFKVTLHYSERSGRKFVIRAIVERL